MSYYRESWDPNNWVINKGRKKLLLYVVLPMWSIIILCLIYSWLYDLNIIPHKVYTNEDFGIATYESTVDKDGDGIEDQADVLQGVRAYIETKPKYKSKYYETGYPNDEYGVCTDVVAQGLLNAGYDLMGLVNEDVLLHKELYDIEEADINIDFRRVKNLKVWFEEYAISLTTNIYEKEEWQGGDIVIFEKHVGIISDKRNENGVPFLIHHARPSQFRYEEDVLEQRDDIIGHYRIS